MSAETQANSDVFQGVLDRYNGITVDSSKVDCINVEQFSEKLICNITV
jgi:hypothetical protein